MNVELLLYSVVRHSKTQKMQLRHTTVEGTTVDAKCVKNTDCSTNTTTQLTKMRIEHKHTELAEAWMKHAGALKNPAGRITLHLAASPG